MVDDDATIDEAAELCLLNTLQPGANLAAAGEEKQTKKTAPGRNNKQSKNVARCVSINCTSIVWLPCPLLKASFIAHSS